MLMSWTIVVQYFQKKKRNLPPSFFKNSYCWFGISACCSILFWTIKVLKPCEFCISQCLLSKLPYYSKCSNIPCIPCFKYCLNIKIENGTLGNKIKRSIKQGVCKIFLGAYAYKYEYHDIRMLDPKFQSHVLFIIEFFFSL